MAKRPHTDLTVEQIETFATDGVIHVPRAISASLIGDINALADRQMDDPGPWSTDTGADSTNGRFLTTRYLWRDDPVVRRFVLESGVAHLAEDCMRSSSVRLYTDHLLVKEPGTEEATPWHQDIPYWPFLGQRICSVWVACSTAAVEESSLEFIRGSHRWGRYFAPESFDGEGGWTDESVGERMPDIESDRTSYDILGFDVEPGDAIIFSAWIVHGSPGNTGPTRRVAMSTRWLGDDTVWHPHPGCDPTVTQAETTAIPGQYPSDDDRFPLA